MNTKLIAHGAGWPRANGEDLERTELVVSGVSVGSIVVGVGPTIRGWVLHVRVAPAYRGQGYGMELYLAAIRRYGAVYTTGHSDAAAHVWAALSRRADVAVSDCGDRWVASAVPAEVAA